MSVFVKLLAALALFQAQTPDPATPGRGGQSTPTVVRKEYDMRQLAAPPTLSENELAGRRLFAQRCGLCHDPVGQARTPGPWLDRETLTRSGEPGVRQVISIGTPRMPGFQYALKASQVDDLLAFLKTVTPEQKPKPVMPRGPARTESPE